MTRFCSHCGQQQRADDRFCVSCGKPIDVAAQPMQTNAPVRPSDHPLQRASTFVAAHARALMSLVVIAGIAAAVALSGSSSETTPRPDDTAPASATVADTGLTQTSSTTTTDEDVAQPVRARGTNGKTYSCAADVLDRVHAAKNRVIRREKILKARRAAERKLERQYPSGRAPGAVVDRYNKLVASEKAQVRWTNRAIDAYNRVLEEACDRA